MLTMAMFFKKEMSTFVPFNCFFNLSYVLIFNSNIVICYGKSSYITNVVWMVEFQIYKFILCILDSQFSMYNGFSMFSQSTVDGS